MTTVRQRRQASGYSTADLRMRITWHCWGYYYSGIILVTGLCLLFSLLCRNNRLKPNADAFLALLLTGRVTFSSLNQQGSIMIYYYIAGYVCMRQILRQPQFVSLSKNIDGILYKITCRCTCLVPHDIAVFFFYIANQVVGQYVM